MSWQNRLSKMISSEFPMNNGSIFVLVLTITAIVVFYLKAPENDSLYAVLLFSIGPGLQIFVLASSAKNNKSPALYYLKWASMLIILAILLIIYACFPKTASMLLSVVSLFATVVICVQVMLFYRNIFEPTTDNSHLINENEPPPNTPTLETLPHTTGKPFHNTLYFMGSFFCICNYLTLSIAFYDQYSDNKAIRKDTQPYEAINTNYKNGNNGKNEKIYFEEGSAIIKTTKSSIQDKAEIYKEGLTKNNNMYKYNFVCANDINKYITNYKNENKAKKMRIKLVGHASDTRLDSTKSRYRSNYELSQARLLQVYAIIIDSLTAFEINNGNKNNKIVCDLEWLMIPMSNENMYIDPKPRNLTERRCVDITMQSLDHYNGEDKSGNNSAENNMVFLDYLYFMVYTITTTGYGDIKPVAGYIKFAVSIANIYEVFFTVLFFAAIISTSLRKYGQPKK